MGTTTICAGDVERFRRVVARRLGLQFEDAKLGFLADVLRRRLETNGEDCETYLSQLGLDRPKPELGALAQELTVGETYFFRHMDQFRAFADVALPERLRVRVSREVTAPDRTLRILSAGCASGEEAYSLAILVREATTELPCEVSIRAVDINPIALRRAIGCRFSSWALRETPLDVQQRWFRQDGREVILNDGARKGVTFEERNLANDDAELWQPGVYDVVFCRNVMMYFAPENAQELVERIARALAPGGYLFLGHAETLRGISHDFHLEHTHGTFYYQRKKLANHCSASTELSPAVRVYAPALAAVLEGDGTWVDTIHKAAQKIQALAQPSSASIPATPRPYSDMGLVLELLHKEQFSEALKVIRDFSSESGADPDVLLLHAVLLAHSGQFAGSEEECRRLVALDELNAGAHYVLALCSEGVGNHQRAADYDQVAIYLDPAFAMPHLHLGLLARRAGDHEDARRELGQAIDLLQREDASRLLLFGGGFNRETLIALCRTALYACGGQP